MRFSESLEKYINREVTVFLTNGVKLKGRAHNVTEDWFELTRDGEAQAVFWHAVATILPKPIYD